jgi:hypothetical protein
VIDGMLLYDNEHVGMCFRNCSHIPKLLLALRPVVVPDDFDWKKLETYLSTVGGQLQVWFVKKIADHNVIFNYTVSRWSGWGNGVVANIYTPSPQDPPLQAPSSPHKSENDDYQNMATVTKKPRGSKVFVKLIS